MSKGVITGCAGCGTSSTYFVKHTFLISHVQTSKELLLPSYGCLAGGNEREAGNS